jgi:hypothetical protein
VVGAILVTTRFWPLVVCAFLRPQSDDQLQHYFDEMTRIYRGKKPFVDLARSLGIKAAA